MRHKITTHNQQKKNTTTYKKSQGNWVYGGRGGWGINHNQSFAQHTKEEVLSINNLLHVLIINDD